MDSIELKILNRDIRLSYSSLSHFIKSPEHWVHYKSVPREDTEATIFGNAFHCYVLRNNDFNKEYTVFDESKRPDPSKDYRTKINNEWKKEQYEIAIIEKKRLISTDDFEKVKKMSEKLLFHGPSKELIEYTRSEFEKEIHFERRGLKFLSYIDIKADVFLADIKTCGDAEPKAFQRDVYKYGYDLQTAVYNDADASGHANFNKLKEFYFIAIEKTPPFGVSVHKFGEEALNLAFEEYLYAVDNFNRCLDDPELFTRGYDFYCNDQVNKVFDVQIPFWKQSIMI